MSQWVLESPRLRGYSAISTWLQDLYGTVVDLDSHSYTIDSIDQFEILVVDHREYVVIATVRMEHFMPPFPVYRSEMDIEVDADARRN